PSDAQPVDRGRNRIWHPGLEHRFSRDVVAHLADLPRRICDLLAASTRDWATKTRFGHSCDAPVMDVLHAADWCDSDPMRDCVHACVLPQRISGLCLDWSGLVCRISDLFMV